MAESVVGVVGVGFMGSGIAESVARTGVQVIAHEPDRAPLDRSRASIERSVGKAVRRGKLTEADGAELLERITFTTSIDDLAPADIVCEAIAENPHTKGTLFQKLDGIVGEDALLTTNTSSIPIAQIASWTRTPHRVLGLHYFSPVPVMKLVEVVRTLLTSDEAFDAAFEFARGVGKEPIACRDNSGFVVNRLLVPYLLDAVRAYEEGVGSIEDIDKGMQLGCGYPMGPFTLLDFVGLDTTASIAEIMFDEYRERRFAAPPTLRKMVAAGWYGRKSGRGFYDYSGESPVAVDPGV